MKTISSLVMLLLLTCSCAAQIMGVGNRKVFTPVATPVTHTFAFRNLTDQGAACSSTATSCAVSIAQTAASSTIVVYVWTFSNDHIASVSGCSATWVTGSGPNFTVYNSTGGGLSAAYALNPAAGCTSITVTLNSTDTHNWGSEVEEFSVSGSASPVVLDALSSTNSNLTSCSSCGGSGFSGLTGTSDLIVSPTNWGQPPTVSSPYVWDSIQGATYALNVSSGTAPTFNHSASYFQSLGFAFK